MKAQFRILSGARQGQADVLSKAEIQVGRHPSSDLRFHPEQDLDVSGQHAVIRRTEKGWYVRDLNSRNGTLLNGHRITAETRLDDTDQLRFGTDGPRVEFRTVADSVADTAPPVFAAAAGQMRPSTGATPTAPPPVGPRTGPGSSTTQRIRVEVARQTRTMKRVSLSLAAVLALAVAGFLYVSRERDQQREGELAALRTRTDSILRASEAAVQALRGQMVGLADALRQSQTQVQRLQTDLAGAQASGDRQQVTELRRQLAEASQLLQSQQNAARVDYNRLFRSTQSAVAMIIVDFGGGPGDVFTGTAFAVQSDDSGGVLLTNRHVVAGRDGMRRARRLGIQFADSDQFFPATILAVSRDSAVDLAVVRVRVARGVPTVRLSRSDPPGTPGDPVAVIGFPLGVELPMGTSAGRRPVAKTTFTSGTISKVLTELVQIDGYGAEGSSGSPIFSASGDVIAVLYGGQSGTNGRVVFGVPAAAAIRLLQSTN